MKEQEVVRFVACAGQRYRVLHASLGGAWLISYEEPGTPLFVAEADLERFERIKTPESFICYSSTAKLSKAQYERLAIIQPLLDEKQCICDKVIRREIAAIALLPMTFPAGDYSLPGKKVIVDRKDSIIELYHNFGHSSNRASYEHAANIAAAQGCRLVYVIATDEAEQINCIEDVSRWSALLHNGTKINGKNLREILEKYTFIHSNADFLFVPRTQQCGAIWNVLQQPR